MDYSWIWLAVIVIAVIVEALTEQLISIWFVPAAVVAMVLDCVKVLPIIQVVTFVVISALGIIFLRKICAKAKDDRASKTNIEAIVGEKCVVTERIDNFAGCGQAKVKGQIWSARGIEDDDVFEVGEVLHVVAIEGVKIICKK